MIKGKIIKGIAGFYYVHVPFEGVFECKARGLFRNQSIKPLIGDNVVLEILKDEDHKGNIVKIDKRKNELVRPTVANIGQVMIVFSVNHPKPNLNLLDRFLVMIEREGLETSICFNKVDTLDLPATEAIKSIYEAIGYNIYLTSAKDELGIETLTAALNDTTTVFAGPSGVGKSSLLNLIQSEFNLEIGELSKKVERGRHTTRHAQLICFRENSYVVDTPGFSSLDLEAIMPEDLKHLFVEFSKYDHACKFNSCSHIHEPGCKVKEALAELKISPSRYENYCMIYEELKDVRRW